MFSSRARFKSLVDGLFKDNGRYYVQKGACSAYLETPTVTLQGGRVVIRSHLSGRFGIDAGGNCIGVGLASWTVVSGAPGSLGAVVRLVDIRIDDVDDGNMRLLLNSGLVSSVPNAIELDVLKAVRAMLQGANSQIRAEVEALSIQSVGVADNKLSVRFDFKLVGK